MTQGDDWRRAATAEQMRSIAIRCPEWRPDHPEDAAGKSTMWGGVAEKPAGAQG
jgi:hypothetical protein